MCVYVRVCEREREEGSEPDKSFIIKLPHKKERQLFVKYSNEKTGLRKILFRTKGSCKTRILQTSFLRKLERLCFEKI